MARERSRWSSRTQAKPRTRTWLVLVACALGIFLVASCDEDGSLFDDCDSVSRRCRTVCDYWCDFWGCYPRCWDQCWYDCNDEPRRPPGIARDSGAPIDAALPRDASPPGDGGAGDLCRPCASNDDCRSGALCILRGGPPSDAAPDASSAAGFCGHACTGSEDCPASFACADLGSSKQCLPVSGSCE